MPFRIRDYVVYQRHGAWLSPTTEDCPKIGSEATSARWCNAVDHGCIRSGLSVKSQLGCSDGTTESLTFCDFIRGSDFFEAALGHDVRTESVTMITALTSWLGRLRNRPRNAAKTKEPTTRLEPIELSPSERERVELKFGEFLADSTAIYTHARRRAALAHALPLYFDWSAFIALRFDGVVVWVPYDDEPFEIEVIQEEWIRNLGLFQGTKLHPDLPFLVPPRPADAIACSGCGGTGKVRFPPGSEHLSGRIICTCGGLGWLPRAVKI